jgi:hypothetical protein
MLNVVAGFERLSKEMIPPWRSMIWWDMDRPSPVPVDLVVKKGSKIFSRCSVGIPCPV